MPLPRADLTYRDRKCGRHPLCVRRVHRVDPVCIDASGAPLTDLAYPPMPPYVSPTITPSPTTSTGTTITPSITPAPLTTTVAEDDRPEFHVPSFFSWTAQCQGRPPRTCASRRCAPRPT